MRRGRRAWVVSVAILGLEIATATLGLLQLDSVELVVYLMGSVGALAGFVAFSLRLLASRGRRDDGDDGGGGGGPGPEDEPPSWWPDFERDFRRYVRERERVPA